MKQVYWIIGGVIAMFLLSLLNYHVLLGNAHWMYMVALASLIAVRLFGKKYLGARRWIQIGTNHFQPSEWVKLILILAVAKYFAEERSNEATAATSSKLACWSACRS